MEKLQTDMAQSQEKLERSQGEVYRLKAKLENAEVEKENMRDEFERGQGMVSTTKIILLLLAFVATKHALIGRLIEIFICLFSRLEDYILKKINFWVIMKN